MIGRAGKEERGEEEKKGRREDRQIEEEEEEEEKEQKMWGKLSYSLFSYFYKYIESRFDNKESP